MSTKLSSTLTKPGIINFPGQTPDSKKTVERLLKEDREKHHCFWGRIRFHNHLSHQLLASYSFGASAKQLQAIVDSQNENLDPIHLNDPETQPIDDAVVITGETWTQYVGQEKYYTSLMKFFASEVEKLGAGETLEQYIFSPAANGNGTDMLLRFIGGAVHPLIQTGYAAEFGSDAMVAQALAQAALHSPFLPELFDFISVPNISDRKRIAADVGRQPAQGLSLLEILREMYDSPILHPVMPYDPDALLSKRVADARKDGRPEEIRRLSRLWYIDATRGQAELDEKVEELMWLATLLLAGSGKPGRKPRMDFFLMHMVTSSLFVPSLLETIPTMESKVVLLRAMLPVILWYVLVRGRPRIDPTLVMSYTETPRPPNGAGLASLPRNESAIGDIADSTNTNPWPEIVASAVHFPEAHLVKTIRSLYYGAQKFGTTSAGGAIGAFRRDGSETHIGTSKMDGTIFVRAAGVVIDALGWVSHGQKAGQWDRSALGWDDAWKNPDGQ